MGAPFAPQSKVRVNYALLLCNAVEEAMHRAVMWGRVSQNDFEVQKIDFDKMLLRVLYRIYMKCNTQWVLPMGKFA